MGSGLATPGSRPTSSRGRTTAVPDGAVADGCGSADIERLLPTIAEDALWSEDDEQRQGGTGDDELDLTEVRAGHLQPVGEPARHRVGPDGLREDVVDERDHEPEHHRADDRPLD